MQSTPIPINPMARRISLSKTSRRSCPMGTPPTHPSRPSPCLLSLVPCVQRFLLCRATALSSPTVPAACLFLAHLPILPGPFACNRPVRRHAANLKPSLLDLRGYMTGAWPAVYISVVDHLVLRVFPCIDLISCLLFVLCALFHS